jgi:Rrf2 family protein
MASVVKISEAASLAMHTVCVLAADHQRVLATRDIADRLHVSEAHLSKVLQRLNRAGFVESVRGPKGGFHAAPDADEASLLAVFEAIEGPLDTRECLLEETICGGRCILGPLLQDLNARVREHLAGARVADLTDDFRDGSKSGA